MEKNEKNNDNLEKGLLSKLGICYYYLPFLCYRLRLNTMTLAVTSCGVYSGQGVSISVTGIAQVNEMSDLSTNKSTQAKKKARQTTTTVQ